jgi:uncharacterized protein involved in outer membrane biogenesis
LKRWPWLLVALLLLLLLGTFAYGESRGWPWLVLPLQQQLQQRLGRAVQLEPQPQIVSPGPLAPAGPATNDTAAVKPAPPAAARLQFWGGITLHSPRLEVAAPTWSSAPYFVLAQDIDLALRYIDLWRAWRGEQLRVRSLKASQLTVYLERTLDGRASWQLAQSGVAPASPRLEAVEIAAGHLHYQDAPLALKLDASLSLGSAVAQPHAGSTLVQRVLQADARGQFRNDTFTLKLRSTGALPWEALPGQGSPAAMELNGQVGRASLAFNGVALDLLHLNGLDGRFSVQGPSLAAVGEPLGLTLPTTGAFLASGALLRAGPVWTVRLQTAEVGASQLGGNFVFDTAGKVPRLTGQLQGSMLKLVDLGPALGANAVAPSATRPRSVRPARVLPTRPFDLAALRAMDADVRIAIQHVDANTRLLEPLHPFNARLLLTDGLLSLSEIDARTGQGHLGGTLALDGQGDEAHWVAALNWDGVQLAQWIRQTRPAGQPPYASGRMQGHATLRGSGRSTAGILATLQGNVGANVQDGRVSHLLLELGGLDLAESLGVYLQGDQALALDCAVADLAVAKGLVTPRVLVLDTSDSTVWVDGSLSLAAETLNLRAVVAPKDFSPLTLRAPLHIGGTFANPRLELDKQKLGLKLGGAVLLGLLNPLAALLPLLDPGSGTAARQNAADCRTRMHSKLQRGLSPQKPASGTAP